MKKRLFNKLIISICMILLCNSAAFCCWEEITPVNSGTSFTWSNDGYIQWDKFSTGLDAYIYMAPTSYGTISQLYHESEQYVFSSRRIGYQWVDGGAPQAATFVLTWAGYVESDCRAIANNLDDYSKAEEFGRARVLSVDFMGSNPYKWMAISSRGAHCPANPPVGQEGKMSDEDTIFVLPGIPAYYAGTMTWSDFAIDRNLTRIIDDPCEASITSSVPLISSVIFNHIGYGDSSNTVVDAFVHHEAMAAISFQCGILSGRGINCQVISNPVSMVFDMNKL